MRLSRFLVANYKSCRDSGQIRLATDITVLAGKNESGKTAVLEGVGRLFNGEDVEDDQTMGSIDPSHVDIWVVIDGEHLESLCVATQTKLTAGVRAKALQDGIRLRRRAGKEWVLFTDFVDGISSSEDVAYYNIAELKAVTASLADISHQQGLQAPNFDIENPTDVIVSYKAELQKALPKLPDEQKQSVATAIDRLETFVNDANKKNKEEEKNAKSRFRAALANDLPRVIFFSDFDDLIEFSTPFPEALQNRAILQLAAIAGLDLDAVVKTTNIQQRTNLLRKRSAQITTTFHSRWMQESVNIEFSCNGENLIVSIKDPTGTDAYSIKQRSRGFQWFLSFFARLQGQPLENTVILIDEPGLFLHAKAQSDVLRMLKDLAATSQIVISTHSPYLIDKGHLNRVRLVTRSESKGTVVENKIHKDADAETLTPIITAIGLDLGAAFSLAQSNNVLVEGQSDAYIIRAMANVLGNTAINDLHIISCVGASRIPNVAALLKGWELPYVAVFDHDNEGKVNWEALNDEYAGLASPCIYVGDASEDQSIEDLFSRPDFIEWFNEGANLAAAQERQSNSRLAKSVKDKVVKALTLFEKSSEAPKPVLSPETCSNFSKLFEKILAVLYSQSL